MRERDIPPACRVHDWVWLRAIYDGQFFACRCCGEWKKGSHKSAIYRAWL